MKRSASISRSILALALLSAAGILTLPASAQKTRVGTVFTETFTGADGTLPAGWTKTGTTGTTSVISNNQLLLSCDGAGAGYGVNTGARRSGFVTQTPGPGTLVRYKAMAPSAATSINIFRTYATIATATGRDVSYFTYDNPDTASNFSRQTIQLTNGTYIAAGASNMPRDAVTFVTMAKLYLPEDASGNRGIISFVSNRHQCRDDDGSGKCRQSIREIRLHPGVRQQSGDRVLLQVSPPAHWGGQ